MHDDRHTLSSDNQSLIVKCTNQSEKPSLMKAPSAKKVHF